MILSASVDVLGIIPVWVDTQTVCGSIKRGFQAVGPVGLVIIFIIISVRVFLHKVRTVLGMFSYVEWLRGVIS